MEMHPVARLLDPSGTVPELAQTPQVLAVGAEVDMFLATGAALLPGATIS